jgi:hypothetical protein
MNDRSGEFQKFLVSWIADNVRALYDQHIDPSDRKYLIQERAKRLENLAREQGMLSLLLDEVGPKSSVYKYVDGLFEAADSRKKIGLKAKGK